ncbi:membrane anchor subunit of succinate dehydrogenase, Sdh4 [Borealophlyctis nickersoniae]|nr:membrane anchor subunit of succinate dehydrogenase, Sdh4 [Borealophlyctis nickersoniae]
MSGSAVSVFARRAGAVAAFRAAAAGEHKSKVHGSYHWDLERGLSVALIPLIGSAAIVGSHPYIDLALGVVIPLHTHIGFKAIIDDYIPARRFPVLFRVSSGLLYAATGLVLYGAYQFNTNDVGITAGAKRLWTGHL